MGLWHAFSLGINLGLRFSCWLPELVEIRGGSIVELGLERLVGKISPVRGDLNISDEIAVGGNGRLQE